MTKQASATVSPADDPTRTFARGQRYQSRPVGIDTVEMIGASDKFAKLQFTRLIERDQQRAKSKGQSAKSKGLTLRAQR